MKVKANRTIAYKGIEYSPGDVFDMDDKTANVNIANKRVSELHGTGKAQRGELPTDENTKKPAEQKPADTGRDEGDTGHDEGEDGKQEKGDKGRHKRRDMRAEGEGGEGEGEA